MTERKAGYTPGGKIIRPFATYQASIVIGFDVPGRNREQAQAVLETAASLAEAAIESSLREQLAALGVALAELRVDWD